MIESVYNTVYLAWQRQSVMELSRKRHVRLIDSMR